MIEQRKGIYLDADYVCDQKKLEHLMQQCGVNQVVLRTNFDPEVVPERVKQAAEVLKQYPVELCLLVGSWWGTKTESVTPKFGKSFESQFVTEEIGSAFDQNILDGLGRYIDAITPDSICMTHARYRNPAYVQKVYEMPTSYTRFFDENSVTPPALERALDQLHKGVHSADAKTLEIAAENGFERFTVTMAQDEILSRFMQAKCETISHSMAKFKQLSCEKGVASFGTNAFSPIASRLCGQDYQQLNDICDFVQPLLGYMEWHTIESVAAWSRWLLHHNDTLSQAQAIQIAKGMFRIPEVILPSSVEEMDVCKEGTAEQILSVTKTEIQACAVLDIPKEKITPVLRGYDWQASVIEELTNCVQKHPFGGVVYQGGQYFEENK